jgi:hypothetical protein
VRMLDKVTSCEGEIGTFLLLPTSNISGNEKYLGGGATPVEKGLLTTNAGWIDRLQRGLTAVIGLDGF